MIEIVKSGNCKKRNVRFICNACGCVFIADNTECSQYFDEYNKPIDKYSCFCPECGYLCYSRVTLEVK